MAPLLPQRILRLAALGLAGVFALAACQPTPSRVKEPTGEWSDDREAAYQRECAEVPVEEHSKCSIAAWAKSAEDVDGGVVIHLNSAAPPPFQAQTHMRCHRAWMAQTPGRLMPACPLATPGLTITGFSKDGTTSVSLIGSTPEQANEVRKRTHSALSK